MDDETRAPSWWHTLPGVLTAIAAIITALTGLVVAVQKSGWLREGDVPSAAQKAAPPTSTDSAGEPAPSTNALQLEATLREATLGELTYSILRIETAPRNLDGYTVRIHMRMKNNSAYPANFWDATFRLEADNVPSAPIGGLNEVVEGRSAKEGVVTFAAPLAFRTLVLQLHSSAYDVQIPLRRAGQ